MNVVIIKEDLMRAILGITGFVVGLILCVKLSTPVSVFIDIPSLLIVLGTTLTLTISRHNISEIKSFSDEVILSMINFSLMGGGLGFIVGLVQSLQLISEPGNIGPSIAVSMLSILYSLILAAILYAYKQKVRTRRIGVAGLVGGAMTLIPVLIGILSLSAQAAPNCKATPLKDHEVKKSEKYLVNNVASLRTRVGPEKFEMIGYLPDIKKLEKTFSIKDEFEIKDIVVGKIASPLPDIPSQTFYQISDKYWVEKDGLMVNMKGCSHEEVMKAGYGAKFKVKEGVKVVNDNGEWVKSTAVLHCQLITPEEVQCYSNGKATKLSYADIKTKLSPVVTK